MKKSIGLWNVFRIAGIISLVLIYIIQWTSMISTPFRRTGADFIAFYTAGRIAQTHGLPSVYNISLQHKIEQTVVGFALAREQVLLYNHMPYLVPILGLLVNQDYTGSFIRWAILMLGVYTAGNLLFLKTLFPEEKNDLRSILMMGALTFFPFYFSLLLGQDTALLFLGIALWCVGILKKQDWLAAVGLAITSVRPHLCLSLALPLLFKHRHLWWRFCLLTGILALTSIQLIKQDGVFDFLNLMQISANGIWYGMNEPAMPNLTGLIWRIFPAIDPALVHAVSWPGYLTGIFLLSILWFKEHEPDEQLLSISIIVVLFTAPHLHYHDLTLLILPLIFLINRFISRNVSKQIALLPLGISLLMIYEPVRILMPYLLYGTIIWFLVQKTANQTLNITPDLHKHP